MRGPSKDGAGRIRAGTGPGTFHLYAGCSGWTREQLRREVELGGWYIFEGDASMVVYGLPAKWAPGLEEKIVDTVHALLKEVTSK